MDKKVKIQKTVLDRSDFNNVIDNKFKFYVEPEPVVDTDTVEELFRLYDKLYMQIPIDPDRLSHKYLVEQSSELYQVDKQLESIQPLLDEVASLRGQLLEANRQILELEAKLAGGDEINFEDAEQLALVRTELEAANNTITALETANTIANNATKAAQEQAKAASEAAKKAAETAAASASSSTGTGAGAGNSAAVNEIIDILYSKKGSLFHAKRLMEDRKYFRRIRGRSFRTTTYNAVSLTYKKRYFWLFEERPYGSGNVNRTYLIPDNLDEARMMTMDFLISELKKGYTAEEIVNAIKNKGSFKNNVSIRTRTYKDPDKETGVLYQVK